MRFCGIELKGGEAILCLLEHDRGVFSVPDCRQRQFTVSHSAATETLKQFHFAFIKLMQDYKVEKIVVIERAQKGKYAGSATSFKLEAAIQLGDAAVSLISHTTMKEVIKRNPIPVDFQALELKAMQKPAFEAAYAGLVRNLYNLDADEQV